ncbi:MAG: NAD-dependent epimerase/dehydratase family protein [Promethearchaeia archaeon]
MKILVTGANGFIGSNLVKKLIESGHEVKSLVLKGTNEQFIKNLDTEIVYGDITKPETLKEPFKDIEIIYHLAAIPSNGWSNKIFKVNYHGTINVFNVAVKAGVKRLIYMSSLVVHGLKNFNGVDENTPLIKPKWYRRPYIKSKIKCEEFLRKNSDKIEIIIIRPGFIPFGPNDLLASKEMLSRFDAGKGIPTINGGKAKICYIYVENLCNGLILAGTKPEAVGQTYILADTEPPFITMRMFYQTLAEKLGVKVKISNIPYILALPFVGLLDLIYRIFLRKKMPIISVYTLKVSKYNLYFKPDKAIKELGFKTNIDFNTGVEKTIEWYRKFSKNI